MATTEIKQLTRTTAKQDSFCCAPIAAGIMTKDEASDAAQVFKALGDPARVQIVNLLASVSDSLCVCDITPMTDLSQPTISFHLKKLLSAGLIEREQRGKWAYYSLKSGALAAVASALHPKGTQ